MHVASLLKVGGGRLIKKFSTKKRKKKKKEKSSPNRENPNLFFWGGGGSILYVKLQFTFNFTVHFFPFTSFLHAPKKKGVQLQVILLFLCKVKKNICCKKKCPLSSTPPMLRACSSCS